LTAEKKEKNPFTNKQR